MLPLPCRAEQRAHPVQRQRVAKVPTIPLERLDYAQRVVDRFFGGFNHRLKDASRQPAQVPIA